MRTPESPSFDEGTGRPKKSCCGLDRHLIAFFTRAIFGFLLAGFSCAGLIYQMVVDPSQTTFVTMFFSLLTFTAGFFLGGTHKAKKKPPLLPVTNAPPPGQIFIHGPPTPPHDLNEE